MSKGGPLAGLQILLVEDHPDTRDLFRSLLEYFGALVAAAATVDEAIALGRELRVDVVVTDIGLRQRSGTWFVEEGRRTPAFARAPVIAVTGRDIPPSLRRMFDAVVVKPVDAESLCEAIVDAVHRRRRRPRP